MKVKVYNQSGDEVGTMNLEDRVFGVEAREDLVHEVLVAQLAAKRPASASTKNRSAVRGGGAKPYRQKGTGRARQGTIRAGQYRGGGVIFGPTADRNYRKRIPAKIRRLALRSCLSDKVKNDRLKVLDKIDFSEYKTKAALGVIENLDITGSKTLFVMDEKNGYFAKSVANIPDAKAVYAGSVNVYDLLYHDFLVLTRGAAEMLGEAFKD
ncbi:MAG: 50S ribosomal protein L4 [Candidatus Coatesbacteria bacterium]|nr:MAG: 50S ribosomal protein L4 [Candidatus Coatesbacteria bacterium]